MQTYRAMGGIPVVKIPCHFVCLTPFAVSLCEASQMLISSSMKAQYPEFPRFPIRNRGHTLYDDSR